MGRRRILKNVRKRSILLEEEYDDALCMMAESHGLKPTTYIRSVLEHHVEFQLAMAMVAEGGISRVLNERATKMDNENEFHYNVSMVCNDAVEKEIMVETFAEALDEYDAMVATLLVDDTLKTPVEVSIFDMVERINVKHTSIGPGGVFVEF